MSGVVTATAVAAFTAAETVAQQPLRTLQLVPPSSITSSTTDACASIALSFPAAAGATSYRIDVAEGSDPFRTLVADTGNVTSWTDASGYTGTTVQHRIWARDAASGWRSSGSVDSATLTCGQPPVTDLMATNPCSSTRLAWTAPAGASHYDLQRRVNGRSWSDLATDHAATSYTDTTMHPAGATVEYQVRPGSGTGDGAWSSTAAIGSWQPFRVQSVSVANSGALGTLDAGDTITVSFTKPVARSSIGVSSIRVEASGGSRGLYLAATSASTSGVGRVHTAAGMFGASATYPGRVAWSNADATWTWSSSGAGTTMASSLVRETWTVGSGPKCAVDGSSLVGSPAPTLAGRW